MHILWLLRQKEDYTPGEEVAAVSLVIQIPSVCQRTRMAARINQNLK